MESETVGKTDVTEKKDLIIKELNGLKLQIHALDDLKNRIYGSPSEANKPEDNLKEASLILLLIELPKILNDFSGMIEITRKEIAKGLF